MATPISRDILNAETNARFWTTTGFRPGQKLDPKNPTDKAMMPVWMDILRKVQAEADAGTLVTTYDHPKVAQNIADAEIANTIAAAHVDAAAKAPDPETAQQHTAAALTAGQVAAQKLAEAAVNQPATVSPRVVQDAAREAAKTPPPPQAPAADHLAHAQTQAVQQPQNGKVLRPEDDPWDPRYVPPSPPREQPSPPPARPTLPPEALYRETNNRFWLRHNYKPGKKLDMSDPQDRKMAKTWMDILHEVEREANEGRLTFTSPTPPVVQQPPLRPTPPVVQQPPPPRPTPPVVQPSPPRLPPMQQPPHPGMQQPGMQPWPPPLSQQPMPPRPGMQPMPPPLPQQPPMRPMPPGIPRPGMQPWPPGMQPPGMQPPGMQPPMPPGVPSEGPPPSPTEGAPTPSSEPTTESFLPEPMSTKAKIAFGVVGLGGLAALVYAVTRDKPAGKTVSFRTRGKSTMSAGASSSAFPSARGGRY